MHAFARVAYAYKWTHAEILKLTTRLFFRYLHEIDRVKAEEQLMRIEASILPHQKQDKIRVVMNKYVRCVEGQTRVATQSERNIEASWEKLRRNKRR